MAASPGSCCSAGCFACPYHNSETWVFHSSWRHCIWSMKTEVFRRRTPVFFSDRSWYSKSWAQAHALLACAFRNRSKALCLTKWIGRSWQSSDNILCSRFAAFALFHPQILWSRGRGSCGLEQVVFQYVRDFHEHAFCVGCELLLDLWLPLASIWPGAL